MSEPAQKDTRQPNRITRLATFKPQQIEFSASYRGIRRQPLEYRAADNEISLVACCRTKQIIRKRIPFKNPSENGSYALLMAQLLPDGRARSTRENS